jgi:hypothetical protein
MFKIAFSTLCILCCSLSVYGGKKIIFNSEVDPDTLNINVEGVDIKVKRMKDTLNSLYELVINNNEPLELASVNFLKVGDIYLSVNFNNDNKVIVGYYDADHKWIASSKEIPDPKPSYDHIDMHING